VVEALRLGANDYLTKPFDFAVALARIRTHVALKRSVERIRGLEQSLAQRNAELEQANARLAEANQRMRHDLEAAAKVQQALLPEGPPPIPGVNFAWQFKPCTELGGDLLNVVVLDDGRVALYVLDVVGHGVKAALLAVMVSRVLVQLLWPGGAGQAVGASGQQRLTSPAEVATRLNRVFPWDERTGQFCTLLYGVLSPDTGAFSFVSAGHPGPVYLPRAGQARILDASGGLIGLGKAGYQESSLALGAGDRLYLYTDGLADAPSRQGASFGEERLLRVLEQGRALPLQDSLAALVQEVEGWCGSEAPSDDISVLAVELAGAGGGTFGVR
jgi:sigma-B regulation protein RsbU (phosphoserine phosphatase)